MKKIIKMVHVNDGDSQEMQNGNFMYAETFPRSEKIIEAFLNNGWILANRTQVIKPAIQEEGAYSFYMNGWDLLLEKEVEDDATNDGDDVLRQVLDEMFAKEDEEAEEEEEEEDGDFDDDSDKEITFEDVIRNHKIEPYEYEVDPEYAKANNKRILELYDDIINNRIDFESLDTLDLILAYTLLKKCMENKYKKKVRKQ